MAKKRRERRTFTEKFKKDLIEQIENGARVSDLAKEHNIQPSQISMWKRKITGKPGKRGRKPGSRNKATAAPKASSAGSSASSTPRSSAAPKSAPRAASSGGSSQADVERMIGRLVLENQRLRDQLEGRD